MMILETELIRDRLEKIFPRCNVTSELDIIPKHSHFLIAEDEMNQLYSLGLVVSQISRSRETVIVSVARRIR